MAERRERASVFLLGAGLLCYVLAGSVMVFAPWTQRAKQSPRVTLVAGSSTGAERPAPARTDGEAAGRRIYIRENCMICHSQVVRASWERVGDGDSVKLMPRGGDVDRYGPPSQPGESGWDLPQLFGTRRIGPDLAREGGKFADAWHLGHFWDPQAVSPGSVMPKFRWLFVVTYDEHGKEVSHEPTVELLDLISYIQSLGAGIGPWRGVPSGGPEDVEKVLKSTPPEQLAAKGKDLYPRMDCTGCHGAEGKGNGPTASTFPPDRQPRNFHLKDQFKYGWEAKSVAETISQGRPPYMPSHPQLNAEQLAELAEFVRSLGEEP